MVANKSELIQVGECCQLQNSLCQRSDQPTLEEIPKLIGVDQPSANSEIGRRTHNFVTLPPTQACAGVVQFDDALNRGHRLLLQPEPGSEQKKKKLGHDLWRRTHVIIDLHE